LGLFIIGVGMEFFHSKNYESTNIVLSKGGTCTVLSELKSISMRGQ
jgi:hypothetical protein